MKLGCGVKRKKNCEKIPNEIIKINNSWHESKWVKQFYHSHIQFKHLRIILQSQRRCVIEYYTAFIQLKTDFSPCLHPPQVYTTLYNATMLPTVLDFQAQISLKNDVLESIYTWFQDPFNFVTFSSKIERNETKAAKFSIICLIWIFSKISWISTEMTRGFRLFLTSSRNV